MTGRVLVRNCLSRGVFFCGNTGLRPLENLRIADPPPPPPQGNMMQLPRGMDGNCNPIAVT